MDYCGPKGIAYDDFLAWSEMSRNSAIAWQIEQSLSCDGCGTRREEWDEKRGGSRNAYHAETFRCPGCRRIEEAYHDAHDSAKRAQQSTYGIKVRLLPKHVYQTLMFKRRQDPDWKKSEQDKRQESVYGKKGLTAKERREQREQAKQERLERQQNPPLEPSDDVGE